MALQSDFIQDASYADHFGAYRRLFSRMLDHDPRMFELPKGSRIADLGCGYGDTLATLRERGYSHLVGVEPDSIERSGAVAKGLDAREGTLTVTGLAPASLDAALTINVWHHTDDYHAAGRELARIVAPSGLLCYIEPRPSLARRGLDFLTFKTPLPRIAMPVMKRYRVMKLEMDTGMYPGFLKRQHEFQAALAHGFAPIWQRNDMFFQYGKMRRV